MDAAPWPLAEPMMDTQLALAVTVQVQSREVDRSIVPDPPLAPNDEEGVLALIWQRSAEEGAVATEVALELHDTKEEQATTPESSAIPNLEVCRPICESECVQLHGPRQYCGDPPTQPLFKMKCRSQGRRGPALPPSGIEGGAAGVATGAGVIVTRQRKTI